MSDSLADESGYGEQIWPVHFSCLDSFGSECCGSYFHDKHVVQLALRRIADDVTILSTRRVDQAIVVRATCQNDALATFSCLVNAAYHFHPALFSTNGITAGEIIGGEGAYMEALRRVTEMVEMCQRMLNGQ